MRTESRTPPLGRRPIHMLRHVSGLRWRPVGVVLAGGRGRRIGGDKAVVSLAGRPLLSYPVRAMLGAVDHVVVVAKPSTALPALGDVAVWEEPEEPSHPLVGIAEALRRAAGGWVLVCAGDMPFVPVSLLRSLAAQAGEASLGAQAAEAVLATQEGAAWLAAPGAPAVVAASADGALQPLLGCYGPACLARLAAAAHEAVAPAREVVEALGPLVVPVTDPQALFNVNSASDLREAEALLASD
jgi:molybdopterin-guanine dinucleotide biosynthesis protein A